MLAVIWVASETASVRERALRYQTDWRVVEPEITGDDLKAMGLDPGPLFGDLLKMLRDARLDGMVSTREEEMAFLEEVLASRDETEEESS